MDIYELGHASFFIAKDTSDLVKDAKKYLEN